MCERGLVFEEELEKRGGREAARKYALWESGYKGEVLEEGEGAGI